MTEICTMTAAQLLARAELPLDTDEDLEANQGAVNLDALLGRASVLAADDNPALSLLFSVLSAEPPEVAAGWAPALEELEGKLHPLGYGPTLAMAASKALAQWRD